MTFKTLEALKHHLTSSCCIWQMSCPQCHPGNILQRAVSNVAAFGTPQPHLQHPVIHKWILPGRFDSHYSSHPCVAHSATTFCVCAGTWGFPHEKSPSLPLDIPSSVRKNTWETTESTVTVILKHAFQRTHIRAALFKRQRQDKAMCSRVEAGESECTCTL